MSNPVSNARVSLVCLLPILHPVYRVKSKKF